jgi:predicted RNase H-like nuclease (RuvC/YqgF family)
MDADDSFGHDEDDTKDDDEGLGWGQRRRSIEAMEQRVRQLEDQNYVLTTRVSALECRNIALEHQLLTMIQALKDANLLP